IRTALRVLDEVRPRSLPFETLWGRVKERVGSTSVTAIVEPKGVVPTNEAVASSPEALAEALLNAFCHNIIEVHGVEPDFTLEISEFPRASPIARRQARSVSRVANLRHRLIALDDFDQFLLPHLDGRHDRRALVAELNGAIQSGALTMKASGRPITDAGEAEPMLTRMLEESLKRLASGALLVE